MLVSLPHQVTVRKLSAREAHHHHHYHPPPSTMFTRAQTTAVTTTTTSPPPHLTSGVAHHPAVVNSDVVPSVSLTITAVATSIAEGVGVTTTTTTSSCSSTPVLDTPTITSLVLNSLEGVHSGVPTRTTPTLTPTTLRNIEQTFLELSTLPQPETHTNQAGFVPPLVQPTAGNTFISVDSKCWGGGTLTQIPHTSNSSSSSSSSSGGGGGVSSLRGAHGSASPGASLSMPSQIQQQQPGRRMGGRRPIKDERLSAEEEERRSLRRERNKLAAARCRKRRLDQTNMLQDETDELEDKKSELQQEIQLLQQQRDELEFLLATHKAVCRRRQQAAPVTSNTIVTANSNAHLRILKKDVIVKEEPMEEEDFVSEKKIIVGESRPRRPTSLNVAPVALRTSSVADLGVPIETPSAGLRGLNFESMMDGGTGLTPVTSGTGLTPLHTGLTPLTTPVVSAPAGSATSNCGTQQRSSSSDLSSPDSVPPKLVSL